MIKSKCFIWNNLIGKKFNQVNAYLVMAVLFVQFKFCLALRYYSWKFTHNKHLSFKKIKFIIIAGTKCARCLLKKQLKSSTFKLVNFL